MLRKIVPRMPLPEVRAVLAAGYPEVTEANSDGSGGSGNQEFRLDKRYSVNVATIYQDGVQVVHPGLFFDVQDRELEQRVSFSRFARRHPADKGDVISPPTGQDSIDALDLPARPSKAFWQARRAAEEAVDAKRSAAPLLALLDRFVRPEEQAQLEIAIGLVYNQRSGMVNPGKAVEHLTKALAFDLTGEQRQQVLLWRAGSLEQSKDYESALVDHLRILLHCSYYDLTGAWPRRPEPNGGWRGQTAHPLHGGTQQDQRQAREAILREEELQHSRYSAVEGAKRVARAGKLDDAAIRRHLAQLTSDRRKDETILGWLKGPNPFPVP